MKSGKNVECEICGNIFYVPQSRLKNKHITCSRSCLGILNSHIYSKKIKTNCIVCNKIIEYKISHFNKIKNHTCSNLCRGIFCKTEYKDKKNPNKRYNYDINFFKNIDSEFKAYLLGWIASDGHISKSGFTISIKNKDILLLKKLRDGFCTEIPIKNNKNNMVSFTVNSKDISLDLCSLFKISAGKKSQTVQYPEISTELDKHFIRGLFDGDGCVSSTNSKKHYPVCSISSSSRFIVDSLLAKVPGSMNFSSYLTKNKQICYGLQLTGNRCLDFLSWIYDDCNFYLHRKKDLYLDWSLWVPSLGGTGNHGEDTYFKWVKTDKNAIPPTKTRASDSGYDITILKKVKDISDDVAIYDTGIKIQPIYGWWFMLVGRSSLSKTGYQLANCLGVIDRTYVGNLLVALRKVDKNSPDIELPSRVAQIIPMPIIHTEFIEVNEFDVTDRNDGGFGSTNKKGV